MQLFYNEHLSENETNFTFDKEESRHIFKVLRKQIGDVIHVTNGKGFLFTGELTLVSEKKCSLLITDTKFFEKKNPTICLAIAFTKSMDRIEWMLEKVTEIGVSSIQPLLCGRSERNSYNEERLQKILVAAMKQSNQFWLPELKTILPFKKFVEQAVGVKFIAHCLEEDKKELKNCISKDPCFTITIGPEGDFSPKEIELAIKNEFIPVALGETRLRTETAGLVAVHTIHICQ
jgi:16S rRNA (uracil1498-N3)-methyltransferase